MRLKVDAGRCEGHGLCYLVDSELFPLDEDGRIAAADGAEVPAGMEALAEEGAEACPVLALSIDRGTGAPS